MKPQRRRAPKGRKPTEPAPSIDQLLDTVVSRRAAYIAGHQAALFDELVAAMNAAQRAIDRSRKPEDMPVLPDGSRDADIQPDDPVTVPYWAVRAAYNLASDQMIHGKQGKGQHARWWKQYRADLIHGHRYALVKKAIATRRGKWPPGKPDVYQVIADDLAGTAFTARASGIRSSYNKVARAIKNGERARFYRSTSALLYDSLLN
jgi:hypothetical protein